MDDETQQPGTGASGGRKRPPPWMRWIGGAFRRSPSGLDQSSPALDRIGLTTLRSLPALLDCSTLPNGVVELVIDDFEDPTRQLFDIHDGSITLVDPGQCVPWASISGSPIAWAMALGPQRDTTALQLIGDAQLARRVLAALPR
jgi:hypothetical protein